MRFNASTVLALAICLAACQASDTPTGVSSDAQEEHEVDPYAARPREFILPATVVPQSDAEANFGIDLAALNDREAEVVRSAWANYQRVLEGKDPECPSTFGLSDGGSIMYDCGAYELMRVRGLAGTIDQPGYEYGPMLDFLNGHKLERLIFLSNEELQRLEAAP